MQDGPSITIKQVADYQFEVNFGSAHYPGPDRGRGRADRRRGRPLPEQLLVAGVANCLVASFVFALSKHRENAHGIEAQARCRIARNAEGRLRVAGIDVAIVLGAEARNLNRIDRVLAQFECFCTVSESVKAGIPVEVCVNDRSGVRLR